MRNDVAEGRIPTASKMENDQSCRRSTERFIDATLILILLLSSISALDLALAYRWARVRSHAPNVYTCIACRSHRWMFINLLPVLATAPKYRAPIPVVKAKVPYIWGYLICRYKNSLSLLDRQISRPMYVSEIN